jgi:lipopolysaccharide/colanic/teichoic acid biosynthesis glycosyltransferase
MSELFWESAMQGTSANVYGEQAAKGFWGRQSPYELAKRTLDLLSTGCGLLLLSPFIGLLATVIKLDSPGPVFFSQMRVGKEGKLFRCWKFRSMTVDADQRKEELIEDNEMAGGTTFKIKRDPRITRVGRFIRKASIDELPQIWNVLVGDMSLVGPRPPVPQEVAQYNVYEKRRLAVKPGITCTWQVSGRSDIPFREQVRLDIEYINQRCLRLDLMLLLKTIPAVLFARGAY